MSDSTTRKPSLLNDLKRLKVELESLQENSAVKSKTGKSFHATHAFPTLRILGMDRWQCFSNIAVAHGDSKHPSPD